ncbi:hypothetical protein OAO01_04090 [Oligoflexia bacterium]|nr:hypothetical protein [Oligoflexia bacterium]
MAKGLNLYKFKKTNIFVSAGVVVLLVVLLFLPEIIGLEGGFDMEAKRFSLRRADKATAYEIEEAVKVEEETKAVAEEEVKAVEVKTVEEPPVPVTDEQQNLSPLAKLSLLMDTKHSFQAQQEAPVVEPAVEVEQAKDVFPVGSVSWAQLKSPAVTDVLKAAHFNSSNLANGLGQDETKAKLAIFNYTNGISKILGNPPAGLSALDALSFLEQLDLGVTQAFVRDNVDRAVRMEWAKVSLTSVLGKRRAETEKQKAVNPFNPQMKLIRIQYRLQGSNTGGLAPPQSAIRAAIMDYTFALRGKEIKEIKLFINDELQSILPLTRPKPDDLAYLETSWGGNPLGKYTFVITDVEDEEYVQHYNFTRGVGKYGWRYVSGGNYFLARLPFKMDRKRPDPRLDRQFKVGGGLRKGSRAGAANVPNGGNTIFTSSDDNGFFGVSEKSGYLAF